MRPLSLWCTGALILAVGCGGSGGGASTSVGGPGPDPGRSVFGSAKFTVDTRSGLVKIEPITDGRAAFGGNSVTFTSSLALSEGTPERRVIRADARNNTKEVLGGSGPVRFVFSSFRNENTALTNLLGTVNTSTYFGSGSPTTSYGALAVSNVNGPRAVQYDVWSHQLLAASATEVVTARGGVTSRFCTGSFSALASGYMVVLGGAGTDIHFLEESKTPVLLAGNGIAANVDGDFSTAQFTSIHDIYMVSASNDTDYDAVVADGTRIRRIVKNATYPQGNVTTLATEAFQIASVCEQGGYLYYTGDNQVWVRKGPVFTSIGSSSIGWTDGAQSAARFNSPGQVRWVGDALYVADSFNNRIRQLSLNSGAVPTSPGSWWVSTLSGTGAASSYDGTGTMSHNRPVSLTQGSGEEIFVADLNGNKVRKISPISGRFALGTSAGSSSPLDLASLANPTGFAPSSPKADPYISEEVTIQPGDTLTLSPWQFNLPEGLSAFSFVITVEAETEAPGLLPAVSNTGSGTRGSPNVLVRGFAGDASDGFVDGPLEAAAFAGITGMCTSQDGVIFVCDTYNDAIRRVGRDGRVTTIAGGSQPASTVDGDYLTSKVEHPMGIDCSPDGSLLVFTGVDCVRLAVLENPAHPAERSSWRLYTIAGAPNTPGSADDVIGSSARFNAPTDVVYVSNTSFYVVDCQNNKIRSITKTGPGFSAASFMVNLVAGSLAGAPGMVDSTSGSSARFSSPYKAALTPSGNLLVTDSANNRIRQVKPGGAVSTLCGGVSGYLDSSVSSLVKMHTPIGIAVEPSGYAYVSDFDNDLIRRVSPAGVTTTVAGQLGISGFSDGTGSTAHFSSVFCLAVAPGGDLYASTNSKIRLLQRVVIN